MVVVVVVVVGHYRSSSVIVVVIATVSVPGVILEVAAIVHCCLHAKESQPGWTRQDTEGVYALTGKAAPGRSACGNAAVVVCW